MISVVTTHWGTAYLARQMQRLGRMGSEIGQIVVALNQDEGYTPPLPDVLAGKVTWVRSRELLSISRLLNMAYPHVLGDYILQLNGDVAPVTDSASAMARWLGEHDGYAMVGGDYLQGEVADEVYATKTVRSITRTRDVGIALTQYGMTRRNLWERVRYEEDGPLGEPGWGAEDTDLGAQIRNLGLKIAMIQTVLSGGNMEIAFRYAHERHSSWPLLMAHGIDPMKTQTERVAFLNEKWRTTPMAQSWRWEAEEMSCLT